MSCRILVSVLGPAPTAEALSGAAAVNYMQDFWRQQYAQVLGHRPDLIVLPECSDRFPALSLPERLEYYSYRGEQMLAFHSDFARENHCWIAYSAVRCLADGSRRNSTYLLDRAGRVTGIYDKNYPVPEETQAQNILPGKDISVVPTEFGKVGMAICFDLNYQELIERYAAARPQLLLFSSMYHGGLMQSYWAYHCQSYFVGCVANAECTIISPLGEMLAHSSNYFHYVSAEINLDYAIVHLDRNWKKIQDAKNKYGRGVSIFEPGKLGVVQVTSEMPEVSAAQIIQEFAITPWDDYYAEATAHRLQYLPK